MKFLTFKAERKKKVLVPYAYNISAYGKRNAKIMQETFISVCLPARVHTQRGGFGFSVPSCTSMYVERVTLHGGNCSRSTHEPLSQSFRHTSQYLLALAYSYIFSLGVYRVSGWV